MTEFSPRAIEQLNQTVREVSRRVRNEAPPRARWQKRKAPTSTGGSTGGGGLATNNCCGTIYQAGSVDLDGLEWATDYTITLASPIGTVTVTDQGSGTWESDVVEVTCTVDEVTVTDEYTVTMTATGNAPGEVIVTVALTSGGGYGGAAGCCETTEAGFAWKYVNCCIVDPLAGWSMTRDPSGFSGQECEIGGCEICVTPTLGTRSASTCGGDPITMPTEYYVVISGVTANALHVDADLKGVCGECGRLNATHAVEYISTTGSGFTRHNYRKDFSSTPVACDYTSNIQLIFLCDTDPERWYVEVSVSGDLGNDQRFRKKYNTRADWVAAITTPGSITCTCADAIDPPGLGCGVIDDNRNCDYPESATVIVPEFTA